ncbi:putative transcription factor bHLH85-like [Capsicum annuum]|nr:putative transcription factor bHLH85-like [Capsicum annuum]
MDEIVDHVKCPSLPPNYVTFAHLRERWLKEKERKQKEKENQENEKKKQCPVHQKHISNGSFLGGKNLPKHENHSAKGWCDVGFIAKEPKLKEVKITARAVEGEEKNKKGYFGERKPRVERDGSLNEAKVSIIDVGEEEMMAVVSVENGGKESSKGKCKEVEEMATVCMVEVVGRSNVDREIAGQKCGVGFMGKKLSWRKMVDGVGELSEKGDSMEQSGQERNGEKEKVSVDVKERTTEKVKVSGAFCAYSDKEVEEVATVCTVKLVEENKVGREITGQKCRVGFRGKKYSWRKIGDGVGEVSEKTNSGEQSGQEHNAEKEKVSIDVNERANEKVKVGAYGAYGDEEVEEVATVCKVEVVEENKVDREVSGQKRTVGFRGKKYSWRKIGGVEEVSEKTNSGEQSGQEHNAEKEKVSIDVNERANEKVKVGAYGAYGDEEVEEVATVCKVEVVEENKVDREVSGQKRTVGFRGKKYSWRKISDRVGEASDKANRAEQSGLGRNAEREKGSIDLKERTNEKVRVSSVFCAYGDKELEEGATDCKLEVVEENKVEREIPGKKCRVGFTGKKNSWKRIGDGVKQVSNRADKADSVELSGQVDNAEEEEVSVDVKKRVNEKVTVSGAFHAYSDKEVKEVATVEENKVNMVITGEKHRVGFRGMKHSWRKVGDRVKEASDKANSTEQSGQECNAEKENVSVDVKERTNEKVTVSGEFHTYIDEEVEEVATVEENKVDMVITGQKHRGGFRGMKHCWRKVGDRVGEVSDKANSTEQSGQEHKAEKENVSVDVKERTNGTVTVSGAFHACSDKEVKEVATVEENKVDRVMTRQEHRVGFRGKKRGWRKVGDRVGEVSSEANSEEQSGQERNAEKEKVSVVVKERTNEKVTLSGAFHVYSDEEVEEVVTVEENKVDRVIMGQKHRVAFRGKKYSWIKVGDRVGEGSNEANRVEQSRQERNAEKEKVSIDVKERTNEKVRVSGAFRSYSDKSKDVLIDSEAGLEMRIERDLGDLPLTDRRHGHGRSSGRVYGDRWRHGSSRRYEPRRILKQRDDSFAWIKKGESSSGNVAEIKTQVANYAGFPVKVHTKCCFLFSDKLLL